MKTDSIQDEVARRKVEQYRKIPLGQYQDNNLPILYDYTEQVLDKRLIYNEVLEKSPGFSNPSSVEVLAQELGLDNSAGGSSLFPSLQFQSVDLFDGIY